MRMKLWSDAFCATLSSPNGNHFEVAVDWAECAVDMFDIKFKTGNKNNIDRLHELIRYKEELIANLSEEVKNLNIENSKLLDQLADAEESANKAKEEKEGDQCYQD